MKAKKFVALVRIWRFVPPSIIDGSSDVEFEGTMTVHRASTTAPVQRGCAVFPLRSFEYFYVCYRGKRDPVDQADPNSKGMAFETYLASDDNPPTTREQWLSDEQRRRDTETALARELLRKGLIAEYGRQKGGRK